MNVKQLIEILEDLDPDAEVLIVSQQHWPFENAIAGVAVREDEDFPGRADWLAKR